MRLVDHARVDRVIRIASMIWKGFDARDDHADRQGFAEKDLEGIVACDLYSVRTVQRTSIETNFRKPLTGHPQRGTAFSTEVPFQPFSAAAEMYECSAFALDQSELVTFEK
ncbi:hypothetical protein GCM10011358_24400 [Sinisalibacter lacisalsi]|uniref:Uncharacterized protein n=1 Tax=Sinisalibacter lacisalsi TaxID=1526570 RepID=A0ABQ1QR95_9RHOB|nr:hypothetical protein GCM10011358_24400 [Sinisalibacter lacisalsi]